MDIVMKVENDYIMARRRAAFNLQCIETATYFSSFC